MAAFDSMSKCRQAPKSVNIPHTCETTSPFQSPPFLIVANDSTRSGSNHFTGYIPDVLEAATKITGQDFVIVTPSDGKYGDQGHSGWWTGMIGMVQDNVRVYQVPEIDSNS